MMEQVASDNQVLTILLKSNNMILTVDLVISLSHSDLKINMFFFRELAPPAKFD
jgi:hypothetical protein